MLLVGLKPIVEERDTLESRVIKSEAALEAIRLVLKCYVDTPINAEVAIDAISFLVGTDLPRTPKIPVRGSRDEP